MLALADIDKLVIDSPELGCALYVPGLPGGSNKIHNRSPYGNAGTIVGATWVRLPSGLWCLSFDGSDDYVNLASPSSLVDISEEITIKFWGYLDDYSSAPYYAFTRQGTYEYIVVSARYGRWRDFVLRDSSNNLIKAFSFSGSDYPKWRHIVFTYHTNGFVAVYKNGAELGSDTVTHASIGTGGTCLLGAQNTTPAYPFKGDLALAEVHNRGWSALEVISSFNQEKHLFGVW